MSKLLIVVTQLELLRLELFYRHFLHVESFLKALGPFCDLLSCGVPKRVVETGKHDLYFLRVLVGSVQDLDLLEFGQELPPLKEVGEEQLVQLVLVLLL